MKCYRKMTVKEFAEMGTSMLDVPRKPIKVLIIGRFVLTWGGKIDWKENE